MGRLDEVKIEEVKPKKTKRPLSEEAKKNPTMVGRIKRLFKREAKMSDSVMVQYLSQKYTVRWLLQKVIGGNVIVINNKVHELNPKALFREKKKSWYIIREIDRKPVSNEDLAAIKARRDDTESDVPLIKAVLGAIQKKPVFENKNAIIGIVIVVVILIVLWFFFGAG